jgi:hypothetical protein
MFHRSSAGASPGPFVTDADLESLIETAADSVLVADGQLTPYDRWLYYWAARSFYSVLARSLMPVR